MSIGSNQHGSIFVGLEMPKLVIKLAMANIGGLKTLLFSALAGFEFWFNLIQVSGSTYLQKYYNINNWLPNNSIKTIYITTLTNA